MKFIHWLLSLIICALVFSGCGQSTGITWHSYVHSPSGEIHYDLTLASYKRGLFFGSCGPSTLSLQWEYRIELEGAGPNYTKDSIELKDGDYHAIPVDSGSIFFDKGKKTAKIDITVTQNSNVQPFAHNGLYKMQKEP